jgi:hypothetical protein
VAAGENRALTLVMAGDGDVTCRYLLKASPSQHASTHSCCAGANSRSGSLGSDDGGATCVVLPLVASFLEQLLDVGRCWWSGIHLPYCWR